MNNKAVFESRRLRRLAIGLGCCLGALPALALPPATPAPGRYACVAGDRGWFQPDMSPIFTLEVLPSSRYHVENMVGLAGEGAVEASPWPDTDAGMGAMFDQASAVVLRQDDHQPLLQGLYGERGGKRTWLLRLKAIGNAHVRCGDAPDAVGAKGAGTGTSAGTEAALAGRPAVTPVPDGGGGRDRRGVDFPSPPVHLPAGARLGGAFEPGRYACLSTLRPGAGKPVSSVYEFHANGEWRRLNVRDETGRYVAVPQTGRFDAFNRAFGNSRDHPDDDYAVYFRGASGSALLLGRNSSGTGQRETRCERTGEAEGPAPAEAQRLAQNAQDESRAKAAANAQARGRRNLAPPPPGATRWQGLYAKETFHQKQRVDPGPYGGFSRLVIDATSTWDFLEFQPNGYVRLGSRPPSAPCEQPAVQDNGEPTCTTYDVDRGRLRIGHDDRGTVSRTDGGRSLKVDRETYAAVPPLSAGRLAGTYQASSCHGALCEKTTWVFGADGTFGAYGLNQAFGTGAGPAGLPMPQAWAHAAKLEGRYRIDGQGLRLTGGDGQSADLPAFLYPPKDRVLSLGGREFLRKDK